MGKKNLNTSKILLNLILAGILIFSVIKLREKGDFIGYVNAGNNVLAQSDIYSDLFNTWPPVFSILAVPIALLDTLSPYLSRFIWMILLLWAYAAVIQIVISRFENEALSYAQVYEKIHTKKHYLIALFFTLRALMDNIMYIQINTMMLFCAVMLWRSNARSGWGGTVLGLSIGSKIYNVFLLPVYALFRQIKMLWFILSGIVLTLLLCFAVYGFDQTIAYFDHWILHRATDFQTIEHRNQSLIASLARVLSDENVKVNHFGNIASFTNEEIKRIYNVIVVLFSVFFLLRFLKYFKKDNLEFFTETQVFVLAAIPLLTPLAWKANYIYAMPAIFYLFHQQAQGFLSRSSQYFLFAGVALLTFSNEALIGREAMYFLENCNVLVVGEILLLMAMFLHLGNKYPLQKKARSGVFPDV